MPNVNAALIFAIAIVSVASFNTPVFAQPKGVSGGDTSQFTGGVPWRSLTGVGVL